MKRETVFGIAWSVGGMLTIGYGIGTANLLIVFLAGLSWLVITAIVVLSRRRTAIVRHGLPTLPPSLRGITLGPINNSLSAFLSSLQEVANKARCSLLGSSLKHSLREGTVETNEGTWSVELETCNSDIVGYTIAFESKLDSALNQSWGRTGRKAYFLSEYDP